MARFKKQKNNSRAPSSLQLGGDPRFVYIMKRVSRRSAWAKITFQAEYKIGISVKPQTRLEQVDKAIEGKIILINQRFFTNARRIESMLRLDFIDSNFRMRSIRKGGGDTEWHYLTDLEYICLEFLLWYYFYQPRVFVILWAIVLFILGFAFYKSGFLDIQKGFEEIKNNYSIWKTTI